MDRFESDPDHTLRQSGQGAKGISQAGVDIAEAASLFNVRADNTTPEDNLG